MACLVMRSVGLLILQTSGLASALTFILFIHHSSQLYYEYSKKPNFSSWQYDKTDGHGRSCDILNMTSLLCNVNPRDPSAPPSCWHFKLGTSYLNVACITVYVISIMSHWYYFHNASRILRILLPFFCSLVIGTLLLSAGLDQAGRMLNEL